MKVFLFSFIMIILSLGCSNSDNTNNPESKPNSDNLTYLALGDSYTIGESVETSERWPVQLVKRLNNKGYAVENAKIIAKTGWTTGNLLSAMNSELTDKKYDLVSVLIGVNNQYQGRSIKEYEQDLNTIFTKAIAHSVNGKKGVFVVSTPDYGATPFGASNAENIGKEIDQFNAVLKKVADKFGLAYYNITPISKMAKEDNSLVARDGLHPSGKMYKLWVDEFIDEVAAKIDQNSNK